MYFIKEDNLDCVLYNHDESLNIKLSEISIDGVESVSYINGDKPSPFTHLSISDHFSVTACWFISFFV